MIHTVTAIGAGNVGSHLIQGLYNSGFKIRQVLANRQESAATLAKAVEAEPIVEWNSLDQQSDLYVLAIPDSLIPDIQAYWQAADSLVVHTAGSVGLNALAGIAPSIGVLYPLQTFTQGRSINLQTVPFFIEGSDDFSTDELFSLTRYAGWPAYYLSSESRQYLHLAAILTNNFTTYLFRMAGDQLNAHGLSFEMLTPLIEETVSKAKEIGPEGAQTGPARRGDTDTINHHNKLLKNEDEKAVYEILSRAIYRHFHP